MKRSLIGCFLVLFLLAGARCTAEPIPATSTVAPISKFGNPEQLVREYLAAANRHDAEAFKACFTPDAQRDYGDVMEQFVQTSLEEHIQFRLVSLEVRDFDVNLKYVTVVIEATTPHRTLTNRESMLVQKIGQRWYIQWKP